MATPVENNKIEKHLLDKRDELMWSLSDQQDYSPAQIGKIFNIRHISTVTRIIARKPIRWQSPWMKRVEEKVDGVRVNGQQS